jgi:hypothetical protein
VRDVAVPLTNKVLAIVTFPVVSTFNPNPKLEYNPRPNPAVHRM